MSRSHPGVQAAKHDLIRKTLPKALNAAQGSPAAPRLPRMSDSAVVAPIRDVSAATSTRPPETSRPVAMGVVRCAEVEL